MIPLEDIDAPQTRDAVLLDRTVSELPVRVDTAMVLVGREYQGPSPAVLRRTAPTTVDWWRLPRA